MSIDNVLDGSLVAAVDAVAACGLAAADLVEAGLARIGADAAAKACFNSLEAERARKSARKIDALSTEAKLDLPLCGALIARKDLFSLAGRSATFSTHPQFHRTGTEDAPVLRQLYEAGAIDLGAMHMSEFAMGPAGWNPHAGFLENPIDAARVTGGSSSGSAAAVARRLVFGAVGTDTGGSIRIPSAYCGVVGLKPTQGAVSGRGVFPVSQTLDTAGPIARSVADCALLFDMMAVPTAPLAPGSGQKLRFAVLNRESLPVPPDDDVWDAFCGLIAQLRGKGHHVAEVGLPMMADLNVMSAIVFLSEAAANHLPHLTGHLDLIGPQVAERLLQGLAFPAPLYLRAMQLRSRYLDQFTALALADSDVLLLPATACAAPLRATYDTLPDTGAVLDFNSRIGAYSAAFNYLGVPALALPAKTAAEASTIGVQIVGSPYSDRVVLQAAAIVEACRG
ncbi:MAG: amidase [Pseudolabrys sp.]|nr:amidase [Pseudolabrys sp.]MDP2297118.1 amidase [Pseudolabrys sp.]